MRLSKTSSALLMTSAIATATALSGCASNHNGNGPQGRPLAAGESCRSIRAELRTMDNRGVPSKVERLNAGKSLSARDRKLAERYNRLLNDYLGARCHA